MISQEKIINSLKNYENYGDLMNNKRIKKIFGDTIKHIDIIIEVGCHFFFIKILEDLPIDVDKFEYNYITIVRNIENDKIRYHKVILSNRKIKYSMVEFTNVLSIKELYYYVANTVGIFVDFIPME
jgi:hypothetical protein